MGDSVHVRVSSDELFTVRDAMRGLTRIVDRLEAGELEKAVLMRGTRMVAVVIPLAQLNGKADD